MHYFHAPIEVNPVTFRAHTAVPVAPVLRRMFRWQRIIMPRRVSALATMFIGFWIAGMGQ